MTDLENNINPTLDNAENTNSDIVQNSFNSWEQMEVTENNNLPENTIQGNSQLNISEMDMWNNNQASESLGSTEENGSTNNEIILWKFENAMTNQTEEPPIYSEPSKTLLENPAILENDPTEKSNTEEEQQKAKLAQKEKLLQLIKTHESKAKKNWFTKWILSWVALTTVVVLASFFFAKDQIIDLLNNMWWYQPSLSANIVNLSENLIDETENTELDENLINETENTELDENLIDETENTELDENLINETENTELDENLIDETENTELDENLIDETENTELDENLIDETENTELDENLINETENTELDENLIDETENTELDENLIDETENTELDENLIDETEERKWYNIKRVLSEQEANWVLPAHCSDLTCYGEDKEFAPCTTFRLSENLDENSNRIGKNWVCKYKDPSELVYVEFE